MSIEDISLQPELSSFRFEGVTLSVTDGRKTEILVFNIGFFYIFGSDLIPQYTSSQGQSHQFTPGFHHFSVLLVQTGLQVTFGKK